MATFADTNAFTVTIAAVPVPAVLSLPTTADLTDTSATVGCTSDTAAGTLYWYVSQSATPPNESDLQDGTGSDDFGNIASPQVGTNTAGTTGLVEGVSYWTHWVQDNGASSNTLTSAEFTTLGIATLSLPTTTAITQTTATIGCTSDVAFGTLYWYVSQSATPPSESDLKDGTGSDDFGNTASPIAGANTAPVTGLISVVSYWHHWLQEGTSAVSNTLTSLEFTTTSIGDPNYNDIDWLYHCDGTPGTDVFTDSGPGGNDAVPQGQAFLSADNAKFDQSGHFTGVSTSALSLPVSPDITTAHTVEFTIFPPTGSIAPSDTDIILSSLKNDAGAKGGHSVNLFNAAGELRVGVVTYDSDGITGIVQIFSPIPFDALTDVAYTYDGIDTWTLYVDGVPVGSEVETQAPINIAGNWQVARTRHNTNYATVYLDELRCTRVDRFGGNPYTPAVDPFPDQSNLPPVVTGGSQASLATSTGLITAVTPAVPVDVTSGSEASSATSTGLITAFTIVEVSSGSQAEQATSTGLVNIGGELVLTGIAKAERATSTGLLTITGYAFVSGGSQADLATSTGLVSGPVTPEVSGGSQASPALSAGTILATAPGCVPAESIPSSGTHGPAFAWNELVFPGDSGKCVTYAIVTPPVLGTFVTYPDTSFTFEADAGIYNFTFDLWLDAEYRGRFCRSIQVLCVCDTGGRGNKVFFQPTQPTDEESIPGDQWFVDGYEPVPGYTCDAYWESVLISGATYAVDFDLANLVGDVSSGSYFTPSIGSDLMVLRDDNGAGHSGEQAAVISGSCVGITSWQTTQHLGFGAWFDPFNYPQSVANFYGDTFHFVLSLQTGNDGMLYVQAPYNDGQDRTAHWAIEHVAANSGFRIRYTLASDNSSVSWEFGNGLAPTGSRHVYSFTISSSRIDYYIDGIYAGGEPWFHGPPPTPNGAVDGVQLMQRSSHHMQYFSVNGSIPILKSGWDRNDVNYMAPPPEQDIRMKLPDNTWVTIPRHSLGNALHSDILLAPDSAGDILSFNGTNYVKARRTNAIVGGYVEGTEYNRGDELSDGNNLSEAIVDGATEYPFVQPTGPISSSYTGANYATNSTVKSQKIFGQRYTFISGAYVTGFEVEAVVGQHYEIYSIADPLGAPRLTLVADFIAGSTATLTFNLEPVGQAGGTTFDFIAICNEPDATPVTWTGNWNYTVPNNEGVPATGDISHANRLSEELRIDKTDDDLGDRAAELLALSIGDKVYDDFVTWTVQEVIDSGTYVTLIITPTSQSIAGVNLISFDTVTPTAITISFDADWWSTSEYPQVQGLYGEDIPYDQIVPDDNAYGLSILVQNAYVPTEYLLKVIE